MLLIIWILSIILTYGIYCHFKKDITAAFICYITVLLLGAFTAIATIQSRESVVQHLAVYYNVQDMNDSTEIAKYNEWLIQQKEFNKDILTTGLAIPDLIEKYDTIQFKK